MALRVDGVVAEIAKTAVSQLETQLAEKYGGAPKVPAASVLELQQVLRRFAARALPGEYAASAPTIS